MSVQQLREEATAIVEKEVYSYTIVIEHFVI